MLFNSLLTSSEKETALTHRVVLSGISFLMVWMAFPRKDGEGLAFLAWICLAPLLLALKGSNSKNGSALGFIFGFSLAFIVSPGLITGLVSMKSASNPTAAFLFVFHCTLYAIPYSLFGYLQGKLDWLSKPWGTLRSAAALTLILILFPQIFPAYPIHALYNSPLMIQLLDLGGVPLLLFLQILTNGYAFDALTKKKPMAPIFAFVLLLGAIAIYGQFRLMELHDEKENAGPDEIIKVASIQPNISIHPENSLQKSIGKRLDPILNLSKKAVTLFPDAELFVLPEIPYNEGCGDELYQEKIRSLSKKSGKSFLVQCENGFEDDSSILYNSAKLFSHGLKNDFIPLRTEYIKMILFPFGEYLPGSETVPLLKNIFPDIGDTYTPGWEYTVFDIDEYKTVAPSLCYETLFSNHIRKFIESGAITIINMTNDAWWGDNNIAQMHFALAAFRSVEFRVPLVRVTNSGVGAFIEATGEVVPGSVTPYFKEAVTSFPLFIPYDRSPYFYLGDVFLWSLLLVFIPARFKKKAGSMVADIKKETSPQMNLEKSPPLTFTLSRIFITRLQFSIMGFLMAVHLPLQYYFYVLMNPVPYQILQLFDPNIEPSYFTWVSSINLLISSILLFLVAHKKKSQNHKKYWLGLSIGFLILSIDEIAMMHEKFNSVTELTWAIPAAILASIIMIAYWKFWRVQLEPLRTRLFTSAFVFLSGGLYVEFMNRYYIKAFGKDNYGYTLATTLEECLEMTGIILLIRALLFVLQQDEKGNIRFTLNG